MSRERLFAAFFFAVFAFLLWQLLLFLRPFFAPLVWAAIVALTLYPLTTLLTGLLGGRRALVATLLVIVTITAIVLPALFLGSLLVRQAGEAYARVQQMAASGEITRLLTELETSRPGHLIQRLTAPFTDKIQLDPAKLILGATGWLSQEIVGQAGALARNALLTVLHLTLMLVAVFFFFRDGERITATVKALLPMDPGHKDVLFQRLYDTVSAAVQSVVLTAVAQGFLGGLGYAFIAGLEVPIFLGFVTALASFLPVVGASAVWLPTVAYLFLTDHASRAAGMLAWGVLVMGMADNVIRPLVIGGRARMPTFLLLFGLLGGLQVYGFLGIFLAPAIVGLLLGFVEIYGELYGPQTARATPTAPGPEREGPRAQAP